MRPTLHPQTGEGGGRTGLQTLLRGRHLFHPPLALWVDLPRHHSKLVASRTWNPGSMVAMWAGLYLPVRSSNFSSVKWD